jgi:DNA-directed RNA polymerase subunit K/omega
VSTYDERLDDAPDPLIEDDPAYFDPVVIALEAVKADLDLVIFDKVDDRDLPEHDNAKLWCLF